MFHDPKDLNFTNIRKFKWDDDIQFQAGVQDRAHAKWARTGGKIVQFHQMFKKIKMAATI